MIEVNLYSICELISKDDKEYKVLLSVQALDENYIDVLNHIDKILNLLFGEDSEYNKETQEKIIKINSFININDYYLPCDIGVIIRVLELLTYIKGTQVFLERDLITKEQFFRNNRRELYFLVSEFVKKGIIDLKEKEEKEEKKLLTLGEFLEEFSRKFFG